MRYIKKKFGQQTIGGGGGGTSAAPHMVLQLLYGQEISGLKVIKYLSEVPTELPEYTDVNALSFAQDGVGSAYLWTDGARNNTPVLILNINTIYPHLLVSGQVITTSRTVKIKVTGTGTDPVTNPEKFQTFYVPYGV